MLFYFQKLSSVPVTQIPRKSLQVLRFSHDLIRLFIKKLKKFTKKNNFPMILLAIILLPLKDQFWAMAKLRQFSPFLQQINKSVSHPFSKIQTRAPSTVLYLVGIFRSFVDPSIFQASTFDDFFQPNSSCILK